MLSTRRLRVAAGLAVSALVAVVAVSTGTSATSQSAKIVIWADADRVPAVTKVANAWAASEGRRPSRSSRSSSGPIRHELTTVAADTAPDVIVGAHDWVGELVGERLDHPALAVGGDEEAVPGVRAQRVLVRHRDQEALRRARRARERRAGHEHEAREGAEVVRRSREAGARGEEEDEGAGRPRRQQGAGGDAYHMYPFFSGLGGYVFGTNKAGNLDPSDIGVANPKFLKNAPLIDKWNKEGLIRSQVNESSRRTCS